jgi:hypothetical protein
VFESVPQAAALAGRGLKENPDRGRDPGQGQPDRFGYPRYSEFFSETHVRARVNNQGSDPQEIGTAHLLNESVERLLVQERVG